MRTIFVLVVLCCSALLGTPADQTLQDYAFTDVSVIDVQNGVAIPHQTVTIHKNRITEVGLSGKVDIPPGAIKIECRGMYIMPGLVDMHVHAQSLQDLALFVANGVTTVRNMRGSPIHLAYRQFISEGRLLGPTFYTCGPILDGVPPTGESVTVVETELEAREMVEEQKTAGYDCIKVYTRLSKPVYKEILKTAKEVGLPVAGHVPSDVGLDLALVMGQNSIEHLTGYLGAIEDADIGKNSAGVKTVKESEIPFVAEDTEKSGVWNCPTLVVQQNYASATEKRDVAHFPELNYVPPVRLAMWDPAREKRFQGTDFQAVQRGVSVLKEVINALHQKGAGILLGTDAPSRYVVPGFSAHRELKNLVDAGLKPAEVLKAATLNAAIFLKAGSEFGSVTAGKRADLILLKADPLKNISNSEKIAGVMLRGKWLPESELNAILQDVKKSFQPPANRFSAMPALPADVAIQRYEIVNNGVVVGEERFVERNLSDGQFEVISQQITDPPFSGSYSARILKKADGTLHEFALHSSRAEGESEIELRTKGDRLQGRAAMAFQNEMIVAHDGASNVNLDFSMVASRAAILKTLPELKIGETKEIEIRDFDFFTIFNKGFQIRKTNWKIQRAKDTIYQQDEIQIPVRVYIIDPSRKYFNDPIRMMVDADGLPVTIQRGSSLCRRLRIEN
ncbi:amidohydrolase family protein [bacterium]|nr:amidohydrolase family protein [bacterium]